MQISPSGTGISSMAAQAAAIKGAQIQDEVSVRLLADSLKIQEDLMAGLLKSLGIGQNVDVVA